MISEGKRPTPPYDIDEKIVKEAICEIYGKHIIKNSKIEFRVEDRVGLSQINSIVTCKLFTCSSLTYHCNENDANEQIDPVSLTLLKDFQRKMTKEVKSTTLQIEFGRIHNIVKAKFSPEKIAEMVKEILYEKRGFITGKKTGIIEKNNHMKIVKNFSEFLSESNLPEKCSVCGKPVEKKAEYADICLSCEEKGYWEDPSGGVHSPDENDPAAMYEAEKYDGKSSLKKGTVLKTGRFGQFKLEVIEDDGEELVLVNLNKNYKKEPFRKLKSDYKGAFISESKKEKEVGILPGHYGYAAKLMAIRNLAMEHYLGVVKKPEDLDYAWERTKTVIESETGESITPELNDWYKEVKKDGKNPKSYVSVEWNKFLHSIRGSIISKETGIS